MTEGALSLNPGVATEEFAARPCERCGARFAEPRPEDSSPLAPSCLAPLP